MSELFSGHQQGIIIAADVSRLSELQALTQVSRDFPQVMGIKVGFKLALRHGLPVVVKTVKEASALAVIYDHQKAGTDIPRMGEEFASVCREAQVDGVIIFPQAGPRTLEGFVRGAFNHGLVPIVGVMMTHASYLQSEAGYLLDSSPDTICEASLDLGVRNFVLPGTRPEVIERFSSGPLSRVAGSTIMIPGIGSQGGSLSAAFEAAGRHRKFAIIGSAIYGVPDPKMAIQTFSTEITGGSVSGNRTA